MISRAGGTKFPGYELFVTLQRKKKRATVYFPTLVNNPAENIYVAPGDTVYVYREQQKFVAVGALGSSSQTSGITGQYAFEQEKLSLNEAVAKAGGLLDTRANPGQVFLYRVESRETLSQHARGPVQVPEGPEVHPDHLPGELPRPVELLLRPALPDAAQGRDLRVQRRLGGSRQVPRFRAHHHLDGVRRGRATAR